MRTKFAYQRQTNLKYDGHHVPRLSWISTQRTRLDWPLRELAKRSIGHRPDVFFDSKGKDTLIAPA